MKIAFLLTQLEVGGAQVRVFQTAAELRLRGHVVDVIFIYKKRQCFENEPKIILSAGERPSPVGLAKALVKLRSLLRLGAYDVFISNTAPANILGNFIALTVGMSNRVAVQTQPPERLSKPLRFADRLAGTLGIYRTIVANSTWTLSRFEAYNSVYRKRLRVVHNGITPRVANVSQDEARERLGLAMAGLIVVNVGRMSVQKDQQTLLRAMAGVEATLVIAGDGELRSELAKLAAELGIAHRVVFLGEIPGDEIGLLLRAADVFAFSSRWETFGLALVEAAASGLPLVVTDLDVSREVLARGGADEIIFVDPGDAVGFQEALGRVLGDPELRRRMSVVSMECAREFSLERHVDRLVSLVGSGS
jgi:glycosyltransferase involved in cell wall biosynthesis